MFHLIEGVLVVKNVNMGNLKYFLYKLIHQYFDKSNIDIRLRPSFFPFTEPSVEVDIKIDNRWLEVLGCGMIHPNVLNNAGIDPSVYSGFAFGLGVERFAMLKHNIPDLREMFDGDKRWLNHYKFNIFDLDNILQN